MKRFTKFFPKGLSDEDAFQLELHIRDELEMLAREEKQEDIFDKQNTAMLGLSLLAQAGMIGSFAAMSASQKLKNAYDSVKASIKGDKEEVKSTQLSITETINPEEMDTVVRPSCEFYEGNIYVCRDGIETDEWKLKIISSATHSIEISGNYCGGKNFRKALKVMRKRLEDYDSLEIHILSSPELLTGKDCSAVKIIEDEFPNRFHFLRTQTLCSNVLRSGIDAEGLQSRENHVKCVLVDGKYFVVGGTNFEEHMSAKGVEDQKIGITSSLYERFVLTASRDMDVCGSGEMIVDVLRKGFFDLYANWINVMKYSYNGNGPLVKLTKETFQEENKRLREKIVLLKEQNSALTNKLQEIRKAVEEGKDLPELFPKNYDNTFSSDEELSGWAFIPDIDNSEEIEEKAQIDELDNIEFNDRLIMNVKVKSLISSWIYHDFKKEKKYESICTNEYIRIIDEAKESIILAHLNINPAPLLLTSLLNAVSRGVHITLITTAADSKTTLASHFYAWANRVNYLALMTGKSYFDTEEDAKLFISDTVRIFEYNVSRTTYHKKVGIIDGKILLIGSYNLSQKSHNGDDELLLTIESPDACNQTQQVLDEDINRSQKISPSQAIQYYFSWKSRFLAEQQKGRVAKLIG